MPAVTRRDVAECSGVSLTVVSQVLNNTPYARIKKETREKVQQVAQELGYIQNVLGQALVGNRIFHIGVALTCNDLPGDLRFQEIIRGIRAVARSENYYILSCPIASRIDENIAETLANLIKSKRVDGLILNKEDILTNEVLKLAAADLPFVLLNNSSIYCHGDRPTRGPVCSITFDYLGGMHDTVKYLLGLGHRRIGLINSEHETFPENHHRLCDSERLKGYTRELASRGIEYDPRLVGVGNFANKEDIRRVLDVFLSMSSPPTAIVTADDIIAMEVIKYLKEHGRKVPDDISVVGSDDSYICEYLEPMLTSLDLQLYEMGRQAAMALINDLNGNASPSVMLPARLVVRNSCKILS